MRDRAQQSWPQLSKTEYGDSRAKRSRSASAKTMFGLLPPSSSEIFFTLPEASRMISWPVVVSPVNATLPMPGWAAIAAPAVAARPGDDVEDAGRDARLERQLAEPDRGQRRVAEAGLRIAVLPAASAGATFQRGHQQREVPRHDQPDHADRLARVRSRPGFETGIVWPKILLAAPA